MRVIHIKLHGLILMWVAKPVMARGQSMLNGLKCLIWVDLQPITMISW